LLTKNACGLLDRQPELVDIYPVIKRIQSENAEVELAGVNGSDCVDASAE